MKYDDTLAKRRAAIYDVTDRMCEAGINPKRIKKEVWQEQIWQRTKWLHEDIFEEVIAVGEKYIAQSARSIIN